KAPSSDEAEGEGPRKKSRGRSKRSKGEKSKLPLILGLVGGGLLIFCCCPMTGLATWYLAIKSSPSTPTSPPPAKGNDGDPGMRGLPGLGSDKASPPGSRDRDRDNSPIGTDPGIAPIGGADTARYKTLLVGKWLGANNVWAFKDDGQVEIDLGNTYR